MKHKDINCKARVISFPVITPGPWTKWYRHPIQWWRMRRLRADIKHHYKELTSHPIAMDVYKRMIAEEDRVFLEGK